MQYWGPTSASPRHTWLDAHFVLTRAGFLHWFRSMEDVRPLGCLNLACCGFEQGKAPCFSLEERQEAGWLKAGRSRRCQLQALSVEECCEWAIAIREAIAVACGRALVFEQS